MCALTLKAIAELLVAKGVINKIVITRLPVGHTHEDIDSKFAKIWMKLRTNHISTMNNYKELIESSISTNTEPCEVVDLFLRP